MTLEQQVVSLDLAKRLKELGVKQESLFWWRSPLAHYGYPDWSLSDGELGHGSESYSAFTVAELGEMLPEGYLSGRIFLDGEQENVMCARFSSPEFEVWNDSMQFANTEADARAKMLIYLLENKLIVV